MARDLTRLNIVMLCGFAIAGAGIAWSFWPTPGLDNDYFPRIRTTFGRGPVIMLDEAHWNTHRATGRFRPFVQLLRRDGYRLFRNKQEFVPGLFQGVRILVIANPLGFRGALQRAVNAAGLDRTLQLDSGHSAFSPREIDAVRDWVRSGGALLLVAGHAPYSTASAPLAGAFGIGMTGWRVSGPGDAIRLERGRGIEDHPITAGRDDADERVESAITYAGQTLAPPSAASVFLRLPGSAIEFPPAAAMPAESRPAGGKPQGIALSYGKGRVVVLTSAATLTAQIFDGVRYGINDRKTDNEQLTLNVLHWLSGL
jgi:hypothetical protein